MLAQAFTEKQRDEILDRYTRAAEIRKKARNEGDFDLARRQLAVMERAQEEYFERLPRLTMSCCPYCGRPLIRSFDPYGLDGLWWRPDINTEEIPACPHFCVLLGAVNFNGKQPAAGTFKVTPGPEVPYIIPRLLELPDMIAVISRLKMANGYIAYPVAYFSAHRPPPEELTAGWARELYSYTTQLGVGGWKAPNDPWDFELLPWLKAGKVRWCPPNMDNAVLSTEQPEQCPYLNLKGERQRMAVRGERAWTAGLPTGGEIDHLD